MLFSTQRKLQERHLGAGHGGEPTDFASCAGLEGQFDQRCFLCSFCAIRTFTSFFTRAAERGLSTGKRIVPLDVWKSLSSFLNASITEALMGNKLQCFENAANPSSGPWYLNVGIR